MKWLDGITMLGLVGLLTGCSDDGLAPPANDAGAPGGTSGGQSAADTSTPGEAPGGSGDDGGAPDEGAPSTPAGDTGGPVGTDGGDSTGAEPGPMCVEPDECGLVNDCCRCAAAHQDEEPPACPVDCEQPVCDALGIPDIGVQCEDDGRCQLEDRNCDPGMIFCDALPPRCPDDTWPEVTPEGDCWTGACVPLETCGGVPDCERCGPDEVCVETITQRGPMARCEPLAEACGGVPTCECLPPKTCTEPFDTCSESDGAIQCACITC